MISRRWLRWSPGASSRPRSTRSSRARHAPAATSCCCSPRRSVRSGHWGRWRPRDADRPASATHARHRRRRRGATKAPRAATWPDREENAPPTPFPTPSLPRARCASVALRTLWSSDSDPTHPAAPCASSSTHQRRRGSRNATCARVRSAAVGRRWSRRRRRSTRSVAASRRTTSSLAPRSRCSTRKEQSAGGGVSVVGDTRRRLKKQAGGGGGGGGRRRRRHATTASLDTHGRLESCT